MIAVAGTPDATQLEDALRALERRFRHGPDGLLMCLGWGASWFERHTALPSPVPRPLPMAAWEDPTLEEFDACLHLAADDEPRLTEVTNALFGPGALDQRPHLALREIRSGFVGAGLVAARIASVGVPREAPLMLGFHSGLRGNQAPESAITISDGPLAGGTTMHVSLIHLDLDRWYALELERRTSLMFSPATTPTAAAGRARLHGRPRDQPA